MEKPHASHSSNLIPFVTQDGSMSFRNIAVDEMYHTKSGAREEAIEKHARALKVWEKDRPVIYDVCFGLGYNAAAAIDLIRENGNNSRITVYCFENDIEILGKIVDIDADFKSFPAIKNFLRQYLDLGAIHYEEDDVLYILLFGDARETIHEVQDKADFVFFDPFSPTHHPEMWSLEFIKDIFDKMNPGAKLSTYSYARKVRESFAQAGFIVTSGPVIGRISPSTIAIRPVD